MPALIDEIGDTRPTHRRAARRLRVGDEVTIDGDYGIVLEVAQRVVFIRLRRGSPYGEEIGLIDVERE